MFVVFLLPSEVSFYEFLFYWHFPRDRCQCSELSQQAWLLPATESSPPPWHPSSRILRSACPPRFHWKGDTDCSHYVSPLGIVVSLSFILHFQSWALRFLFVLFRCLPPFSLLTFPCSVLPFRPTFPYPCGPALPSFFVTSHFSCTPCSFFSPSTPYVFFLCPHFFRFASVTVIVGSLSRAVLTNAHTGHQGTCPGPPDFFFFFGGFPTGCGEIIF